MKMKKLLILFAALLCVLPLSAQKMSKEEKAAAAKEAYDAAVKAVEEKAWVIVPTSYYTLDGDIETNDDNSVFLSYERANAFAQGRFLCGNANTNIAEVTEYTVKTDKKGNIKIKMVVNGRQWRGTYQISVRANSNDATINFTPPTGNSRKFDGPLVPLAGANYYKRSNPI